jgi:transposase
VRSSVVSEWTARSEDVPLRQLIAVPVDVGKSSAAVMAVDFTGRAVMPAVDLEISRDGVDGMLARLRRALPAEVRLVRVGIEAAGHYHRPLTAPGVWPEGWQVVELNPAHVTAQRRVNGSRGVKTDRVDLAAIADLLLAGRGLPVVAADEALVELSAWAAHRRRRIEVRTATKNQLLGQLDRTFPGITRALPDVLGTKVIQAGRGAFRRPGAAGPAGRRPVPGLRRPPWGARVPGDGRPAGPGRPRGDPDARGTGRPAGARRRPGPAG